MTMDANVIKTLRGTPIRRYGQTGVGKLVGQHLYLHYDYVGDVIHSGVFSHRTMCYACHRLADEVPEKIAFKCVRFGLDDYSVRFDEAPDFDEAREPHVGRYFTVMPNGTCRRGSSNAIWHHKWLFVKPEYSGFDVLESMAWSRRYCSVLKEVPKGSDRAWQMQLKKHGLQ